MALNLFAVPPETPFLDAIARGWLADHGADPMQAANGLILLPTRRAARSLAEAFLRANDGRPLLLPRITALGALDEAPLALAGALDLPPAVEPAQRLAALTRLILAMGGKGGAPRTADRAWVLAQELASLMDEAERAGIDLADRLPDAADPEFALHWAQTLEFLHIVTAHWPAWLAANRAMNPAARQVALLEAQAAAWQDAPPGFPVLVAGTTAGIPAVARLLRTVARMDGGQVVLPQLDLGMDAAAWEAMEESHAQAGLARLLADLGAVRADVRPWLGGHAGKVPSGRFALLSRALLPAPALGDWLDRTPADLAGLARLHPADQQQEAQAIALVLRDALETPGRTAALVTPDRALAGRVAAELLRFGIVADDSAGEKLSETPPAVFLRLLVSALAEDLAPVPLLALLKHPFCAAGLSPLACRDSARRLERACLRGPRPTPGITGLRQAADASKDPMAAGFLARLEACLEPALRMAAGVEVPPAQALEAVIEAAERLAATDKSDGASRLWAAEEGEALAAGLSALRGAVPALPDIRQSVLPGLLDAALEGQVVRSRRALRGRGGVEHPRVFIWGLLEARLQQVDLIVLGGLAETVWPPLAEPGPWLSRPMRRKAGLPAPEEAVGQAAHDFLAACCAAPEVVLSCPERRDGAPAVPARWLARLDMLLAGRGQSLPSHPAAAWAAGLDQPAAGPVPVRPPRPAPPVRLRPRKLSVTEIETWLRDPYAIHARHILRLPVLKPLEEATDAADYGTLVHDGMRRFLAKHGAGWPADARSQMRLAMDQALASAGLREALRRWWAPRLERIADWVCATEDSRRTDRPPAAIAAERAGWLDLHRPGGTFRLTGRADRIERYADGTLAILDYKTGQPPTQKAVAAGLAPQLLLEATMASKGGFGQALTGSAAELVYWQLTGGIDPGKAVPLYKKTPNAIPIVADDAYDRLCDLIDAFDRPEKAYLSRPYPDQADRFAQYEQLARVAEWSSAGDEDE
jgi:ATP-dependent helicase/nuclease subunit B